MRTENHRAGYSPENRKNGIGFVVSRVLKDEKEGNQLSFLEGDIYDCFIYVTNEMELLSKEVAEFYGKRGNCENYFNETQ